MEAAAAVAEANEAWRVAPADPTASAEALLWTMGEALYYLQVRALPEGDPQRAVVAADTGIMDVAQHQGVGEEGLPIGLLFPLEMERQSMAGFPDLCDAPASKCP